MQDIEENFKRNIQSINKKLITFKNEIFKLNYSDYKNIVAETGEEISILLDKLFLAENRLFKNKKQFGNVISFLSLNAHNFSFNENQNLPHLKIKEMIITPKGNWQKNQGFQSFYNKLVSSNDNNYITLGTSTLNNVSFFQCKEFHAIDDYVKNPFALPMGMIYSVSNLKSPYIVETRLDLYLNLPISEKHISRMQLIKFTRNKLASHQDVKQV